MPKIPKDINEFNTLLDIVKILRGPNGCPWDREQTHKSLIRFALEEAYELAEAIDQGQDDELIEELGDLLLQVVIHSEIANQQNKFNIQNVIQKICEKMIRRHPHVFADQKVKNSQEVLENWNTIKVAEKQKANPQPHAAFEIEFPSNLPALIGAHKIGEKTKTKQFDWSSPLEVIEKVEEEWIELKEALGKKTVQLSEVEHELGDLLFTLAQLGRHLHLEGETALRKTNKRFRQRFTKMQILCQQEGKDFSQVSSQDKESYWQKAKLEESAP